MSHSTNYEDSGSDQASVSVSPKGFSTKWTLFVNSIRQPILKALQTLTHVAATSPKLTILCVVLLSLGLMGIGLATNFSVDVDEDVLWTPRGSDVVKHMNWIDDESGYELEARDMLMLVHKTGVNVIDGRESIARIFEALDSVRNLTDYATICDPSCDISGVTNFWNNTASIFEEQATSDDAVIQQLSSLSYPDTGSPVSDNDIFGNVARNADSHVVEFAQSYIVRIEFPGEPEAEEATEAFEEKALDVILELDEKWTATSDYRVEVFAERSFPDEFERAIVNDIPLVPVVFVIMGVFTSTIFFRPDRNKSRALLGLMAVVSVLLSILAGYGLMFVCGVNFTSMTQILPFVFFGVGLDDSYILTGAFFRLDRKIDTVERVHITIDEVGMSIFLTTLTSSLAFGLGCISTIPAVFWLCVYAVPTIVLILLWQLTFFIGCLVLDERRIAAGNRDMMRCIPCNKTDDTTAEEEDTLPKVSTIDRMMERYAEKLLQPVVKVIVVLVFIGIAIACSISTTQLRQAFEFTDVLPGDSYISAFFNALDDYTASSSVSPFAYFRFVDQSDPKIRLQMNDYVNNLVAIESVVEQPEFCWFRDFDTFLNTSDSLEDGTFPEQLDQFLADPVYADLYELNIVRDAAGNVFTSRCRFKMDNVDLEDVNEQIDALLDQRDVTDEQEINKDRDDEAFFTYEAQYNIWAFFSRSAQEVTFTTLSSIAAVTLVTLFLVPHWSAALFVFPLISVLYIDLLGVLQWAGIAINPVSYITLVMSIGLLVDFILHVLLKYYESPGINRREKTIDMLKTMGSSILIGAITTFLGTLPLAFSSSDIFSTVFVAFLGLVALGASHGLILLPVVLSTIGPEAVVSMTGEVARRSKEEAKVTTDSIEAPIAEKASFESEVCA